MAARRPPQYAGESRKIVGVNEDVVDVRGIARRLQFKHA
jgi:hypothetical protein